MADDKPSLKELKSRGAALAAQPGDYPVAEVLDEVRTTLVEQNARTLRGMLIPLYDALPPTEPVRANLEALLTAMAIIPAQITERLKTLAPELNEKV